MNETELARLLLLWEDKKEELAEIEQRIQTEVMALQKSFTVGNITAKYSGGRKTFDYEAAAQGVDPEIISRHTTTPDPKTDWKSVCAEAEIELVPFKQTGPSVSIKIK